MTKHLYVIGHPISHSKSAILHNALFKYLGIDADYTPLDTTNLPDTISMLKEQGFHGANVTMPWKKTVSKCVDSLSPMSFMSESVNTLYWEDNELCGTTTDAVGFMRGLGSFFTAGDKNITIIGSGGVARCLAFAMAQCGNVLITSRNEFSCMTLAAEVNEVYKFRKPATYIALDKFTYEASEKQDIIINATPCGMELPGYNYLPIPEDAIHPHQVICDCVYNPIETKLVSYAKSIGCKVVYGYEMFIHQALESLKIWFPDVVKNVEYDKLYKLSRSILNV